MKKLLTLCMVCDDEKVLLGMKKRGFGEGRWNGFGGKVEAGETIEAAAMREVQEEIGIDVTEMTKVGIIEFAFVSDPMELEVHIFKVTTYLGEPTESEEMRPRWFAYDEVPFAHMWADDEFWFPYLQRGTSFKGRFLFDKPATSDHPGVILEQALEAVESL